MRIIFMGTPDFSVPTLEALVASEHEVAAVVTQPDKPKGRGKEIHMSPVKECALKHNIPVYQPVRARDEAFVEEMRTLKPDAMVVIAFGQILPKSLLDLPKYGCVNIHASLLPKYRGAAPIQWAVINGDEETGITTMMMDVEMDTGDMLEKTVVKLNPDETGGSLHDKLAEAGGDLILETLRGLEAGTLTRIPQEGETCYAGMITKTLGKIDWTKDAASIERLIRGMSPWPSAYTSLGTKTVKLWKAQVLPQGPEAKAEPGTVVSVSKDSFSVQTGDGLLLIRELQLEGKKRMETAAFLRGCPLKKGDRLG